MRKASNVHNSITIRILEIRRYNEYCCIDYKLI